METMEKVETMKTINATKQEFVDIINGLFAVQDLQGKEFSLLVSKNIHILQKNLKDIQEAGKPSEEFLSLAQQVNEIANANEDNSKEQIDALEKENKELVESRKEQMDKVADLLKANIELTLHILPEAVLPEEVTAKQINSIITIIE
jgi:septal ring factor EnvC (AmiA/AmiB activator)